LSHIEVELGQRNTVLIGFDQYRQVQARQNVDSVLRLFVNDYRKWLILPKVLHGPPTLCLN
jgi:hypothetical protein